MYEKAYVTGKKKMFTLFPKTPESLFFCMSSMPFVEMFLTSSVSVFKPVI